jgi:hypothetical protein
MSGRFDRCIPIGEWRDNAYRVRPDIEDAWGGLTVKNGYIQRSAVPPEFLDAARFHEWFQQQGVNCFKGTIDMQTVIIVHLRRPKSKAEDPKEMRSDPFWEFGSFGLTGCHDKNLMHPKNAAELNGVRFAFVQGGTKGTRLVHLTPPVKIVKHNKRIEARWSPAEMPFRYDIAPILSNPVGVRRVKGSFQVNSEVAPLASPTNLPTRSSKFMTRGDATQRKTK